MKNEELMQILAAALSNYLDKDGLLYFKQKLDALFETKANVTAKLNQKVDKVEGKGLSTNDYTTAEKSKLAGIAAGAQANVIESVKVDGAALPVAEKAVNIDLSSFAKKTDIKTKTSQLTNDSDFQNGTQVEQKITGKGYQTSAQVQSLINAAVGKITGIDFQVVTELPGTGVKGVIYLKSNGESAPNTYDEFIWVTDKYEKIGSTAVDLSGYLNTTNFKPLSNAEIDAIFG